jgi:hypothetical protein
MGVQGGLMLLGTYSPVFKTPLGALTTLLPLSIVLVISMVQEGLADVKRHRADDEVRRRRRRRRRRACIQESAGR